MLLRRICKKNNLMGRLAPVRLKPPLPASFPSAGGRTFSYSASLVTSTISPLTG